MRSDFRHAGRAATAARNSNQAAARLAGAMLGQRQDQSAVSPMSSQSAPGPRATGMPTAEAGGGQQRPASGITKVSNALYPPQDLRHRFGDDAFHARFLPRNHEHRQLDRTNRWDKHVRRHDGSPRHRPRVRLGMARSARFGRARGFAPEARRASGRHDADSAPTLGSPSIDQKLGGLSIVLGEGVEASASLCAARLSNRRISL